jgi:putative chitinase
LLTLQNLKNQWMHADVHNPGLVEGMAISAADVFSRYGINSDLVIAHLMAQMSVETGGGVALRENLTAYTQANLMKVFHFSPAAAAQYAGNAQMIGELAYGGKLGNAKPPSNDGYVFRGTGLIQLTGRDTTTAVQKTMRAHGGTFDIVENPNLIIEPAHALECAVAFFLWKTCISFAEKDCGDCVSYLVNGGFNGLAQRRQQLTLWKKELGVAALSPQPPCPKIPRMPTPPPV